MIDLFELWVVVVVLHGVVAPGLESVHVLDQSEVSIVVTWQLSTNHVAANCFCCYALKPYS